MTALLAWTGAVIACWLGWRGLQRLAAIGARSRRQPFELWRVASHPPVHVMGFRTWSASGAELVTIGVYRITVESTGEEIALLHEIATLEPSAADAARAALVHARTKVPQLGGLH